MTENTVRLDSISQFIHTTHNYQLNRNNFREKKNQIFSVQEKSRFIVQNDESIQQEETTTTKKMLIPKMNFILRLNSGLQVSSVANDTKQNFSNIIVLDVNNARLSHLPDTVILQMPLLQILNLQNNLLSELPSSVYSAPLVQLNVNNNLLRMFQCDSQWQDNLERLDVGKNHVRPLPTGLWLCKKLTTLDIRSNDFDSFGVEILNLENQISAIGIDWVKYSLTKYESSRNDILRDQDLLMFWEAIKMIIKQQDVQDETITPLISCAQFIENYDQLMGTQEKIIKSLDMGDDVSQLQLQEHPFGDSKSTYLPQNMEQQEMTRTHNYNLEQIDEMDEQYHSHLTLQCIEDIIKKDQSVTNNIIHMTVINEDLGVLRSLLGTQLELAQIIDDNNHTPLSLAISDEKYYCAKILLNAVVDVNIGGGTTGSCVNLAVQKSQYFLLRDLIANHANVNIVDKLGNGALHYLIPVFKKSAMEAIKMAYLLIEAGVNPNLKNNNGQTPLQLAVKKNVVQAVKFALQFNHDSGSKVFDFKIQTSKDNQTLLHLACKSESIKNILQIGFLQPYNLFQYNAHGVRPFDQIQKNYTLSKLLQILESTFIRQTFRKKTEQEQEIIPLILKEQRIKTVSSQDVLDEQDEFGNSGPQIIQGMAQMKMNPKLKKSGNNQHKFMSDMFKQDMKSNTKNKIPKENINEIHVKSSFQQRNDLTKVESYNKSLQSLPTVTLQYGIGKQLFALVQQINQLQNRAKQQPTLIESIIIQETIWILNQELIYIKTQDTLKIKLEGAYQDFEIEEIKLPTNFGDLGVMEKELMMRNIGTDVQDKGTFCNYESLQLMR